VSEEGIGIYRKEAKLVTWHYLPRRMYVEWMIWIAKEITEHLGW